MTDLTTIAAAVDEQPSPQDVACALARLVWDNPVVTRLWVRVCRDYVETWLLTEPIDAGTELRVYDAAEHLYDQFPSLRLRYHVLNPSMFVRFDLDEMIPQGAEEIKLRPSSDEAEDA